MAAGGNICSGDTKYLALARATRSCRKEQRAVLGISLLPRRSRYTPRYSINLSLSLLPWRTNTWCVVAIWLRVLLFDVDEILTRERGESRVVSFNTPAGSSLPSYASSMPPMSRYECDATSNAESRLS